jgi:hypothetical protein
MLNANSVIQRASKILAENGMKPDLSGQARAVVIAICEAVNASEQNLQVLVNKATDAVKETPTGRMKKPTIEEIKLQGAKIGLPDRECEKFFDHYETKGWRVGMARTPMRLWTSALANWKRKWQEDHPEFNPAPTNRDIWHLCSGQFSLTNPPTRDRFSDDQSFQTHIKLYDEWKSKRLAEKAREK